MVNAQRLWLPTGLVKRHHEVRGQSFALGVLPHEALEFGDEVVASAGSEVGADAVFDRGEAEFGEACDLGFGEGVIGELLEHMTTPGASASLRTSEAALRIGVDERTAFGDGGYWNRSGSTASASTDSMLFSPAATTSSWRQGPAT